MKIIHLYLLNIYLLSIGCAVLFTEQEYILIDEKVEVSYTFSGVVFSISGEKDIRKIVILGSGTVQNIEIFAQTGENQWVSIKKIKEKRTFPIEIHTVVRANAVRILQKTTTGRGNIDTVQFYTLANKQGIQHDKN